jgi:quercetin dioxygenase-like cupin family protein
MSMAYPAQADQQQKLEWLDGGVFAVLLDSAATDGRLTVGRFTVNKGEAPPYHVHTREDEVFMLIKGTALVWSDDQEAELSEGGIVYLPKNVPHGYRITSDTADLLMICTPRRHRRHVPARRPRPEHPAARGLPDLPGTYGRSRRRVRPDHRGSAALTAPTSTPFSPGGPTPDRPPRPLAPAGRRGPNRRKRVRPWSSRSLCSPRVRRGMFTPSDGRAPATPRRRRRGSAPAQR